MDNEQDKDKSQALVKYEPQPLTVVDRLELYAERKRQELRESLQDRQVHDPITGAIFTIATLKALAISAAVSIGTALLTSVLTPKQRFTEERGRRTGDLVINSELGILIPEVYFGMLDDGYGGSWVPAIVGWTSGLRKHDNTTTTTTGGGKFGGGGTTTDVKERTYDLDWLLIWANKGPYRVLRSKANSDIIFDLFGQAASYEGESASSYTAPYVLSSFSHASGGKEVTLQNEGAGNGGIVQWTTVQSNGAATRQLTIYYRTSSSTVPIRVNINGGANQDITLAATNEVYLAHTIPVSLNDGVNTVKIQNRSTTLNIGIDKIYVFPGHSLATAPTGVFAPVPGADLPYDPELPPDPTIPYELPLSRWNAFPEMDSIGAQSGTMNLGGNANFAIYPGNTSQLPDPTYEAAIDAQFGAGSTPAYRGRCYQVDSAFFLTRWGGVVPNRIALLEHETIKNKKQFDEFMCSRVGMPTADRDFSDLETITPRGLRVMGTKFEAREPMASAEIVYDVVYCEQDGQLFGKRKAALTSVVTLTDKDFAWSDEEETPDGPLTLVDVIEPNEIDLPRRADVKYVDLDRDGEPGLQGYARQVTEGEESTTLDLQWTLTREEAQALAQKEVYRRHIEKPCRYVLSWEHLWINVGNVFTATLSDGFTYTILHAKDSGGLGVRECEGIILDEPIFDQSAVVDPYGYEAPVVPIPAMTVALFLDTPLLRDGDETNNNGVGYYIVGTPRTNVGQTWQGFTLHIQRHNEWFQIAESTLPGTIGTVVSAVDLSADTSVIDHDGVITVDLYGTTATLSSIAEDDLDGVANLALIGDMVFQFATATKLGGFDNRWELSVLLNGRKGTEHHVTDTFTDKRFVFLDGAVKFVPAMMDDLNVERDYVAVTSGQSLDDAAVIPFTWTGMPKQPYSTTDHKGTRDSDNDLLIEFNGRTRIGGGVRSFAAGATNEEAEEYRVQILNSGSTTLPNGSERIMTVVPGVQLAAVLTPFTGVTHNTLAPSGLQTARSFQESQTPNNFIEGSLILNYTSGNFVAFGVQRTGGAWKGLAAALLADQIAFGGGDFPDTLSAASTIAYLAILDAEGSGGGPFSQRFYLYENGIKLLSASNLSSAPDYDPDFGWGLFGSNMGLFRIKFNFVGSTVKIQKTHTQNVPFTTIATGTVAAEPSYFAVAATSVTGPDEKVQDVRMTCNPFPKTIYAATQQTEDGFTPGDPIQMDIWQHSKLVGAGPKSRVLL